MYVIIDVPAETPVTPPEIIPTVATELVKLLQVPPTAASSNDIVLPWHTVAAPVIGERGLTVTSIAAIHPDKVVYLIVAVPEETPVTIPNAASTVATVVVGLLQIPPEDEYVKVVVFPWQTTGIPPIGSIRLTVIPVVV